MTYAGVHVLERKSPVVRGGQRVAPRLREEMDARGLTAKELALQIRAWAAADPNNREAVDYRTIQKAMDGQCGLETYFTLSGFLGWDFIEEVQTPVIGADPITAREVELEQRLASAAALHARLERERAARSQSNRSAPRLVGTPAALGPRTSGEGRTFDPQAPQGA